MLRVRVIFGPTLRVFLAWAPSSHSVPFLSLWVYPKGCRADVALFFFDIRFSGFPAQVNLLGGRCRIDFGPPSLLHVAPHKRFLDPP